MVLERKIGYTGVQKLGDPGKLYIKKDRRLCAPEFIAGQYNPFFPKKQS
jgi:hypothetical protein